MWIPQRGNVPHLAPWWKLSSLQELCKGLSDGGGTNGLNEYFLELRYKYFLKFTQAIFYKTFAPDGPNWDVPSLAHGSLIGI